MPKETRPIRVYRDHPDFDRMPWFMLGESLLSSLHVVTYYATFPEGEERTFELLTEKAAAAHPGCVLVHL